MMKKNEVGNDPGSFKIVALCIKYDLFLSVHDMHEALQLGMHCCSACSM